MARKVIIDTDPGIDDAFALTMALFDPRLEVVAVTAVGGNVPGAQATKNVQTVIDQLDPPRLPRIGRANEPETGLPADAKHIFGEDGLGNVHFPVAELHNIHPADKVIYDAVKADPHEVTIICLGPLTNLALALQRDPEWASLVRQIIIMGGAVSHPGNVTPTAEFNIYCDPVGARHVFQSPTTKTLIPLDVTEQLLFSYNLLDQLPNETTRAGKFLKAILPHMFRSHRQVLGLEGVHLHDAVAVVAALHPELFGFEAMAGDVELSGELTSGMTLFDRRKQRDWRVNMEVALEIDTVSVEDAILRCVHHAGKSSA